MEKGVHNPREENTTIDVKAEVVSETEQDLEPVDTDQSLEQERSPEQIIASINEAVKSFNGLNVKESGRNQRRQDNLDAWDGKKDSSGTDAEALLEYIQEYINQIEGLDFVEITDKDKITFDEKGYAVSIEVEGQAIRVNTVSKTKAGASQNRAVYRFLLADSPSGERVAKPIIPPSEHGNESEISSTAAFLEREAENEADNLRVIQANENPKDDPEAEERIENSETAEGEVKVIQKIRAVVRRLTWLQKLQEVDVSSLNEVQQKQLEKDIKKYQKKLGESQAELSGIIESSKLDGNVEEVIDTMMDVHYDRISGQGEREKKREEKKEAYRQYKAEVEGDIEKYLAKLLQVAQSEPGANESSQEVIDEELIEPEDIRQEAVQNEGSKEEILDEEIIEDSEIDDETLNAFADAHENGIPPLEEWEEVLEEIADDTVKILGNEIILYNENEAIQSIESELQQQKELLDTVESSEKVNIRKKIKELEKSLLEAKRAEVRKRNAEYIQKKQDHLQLIKNTITALENGEEVDFAGSELPQDLKELQSLYQKEFTNTVNILAGLHMVEEIKDLYKSEFVSALEDYENTEKQEDDPRAQGIKKLVQRWKKIPVGVKIGTGLGLGVIAGGAGVAGLAAGGALLGMKAMGITSAWAGADAWTQKRLEKGRVKEVEEKIKKLSSADTDITAEDMVELLAIAQTTKELTGQNVLPQDKLQDLLESAASRFAETAQVESRVDSEKQLEQFDKDLQSDTEVARNGRALEDQQVFQAVEAISNYKQEQEEQLKRNKREKRINRYIKSGGVALGVAFSGEILRGSFEGAQAMFDSAESGIESATDSIGDLNFEGAPNDGGGIGFTDLGEPVNNTPPQAYAESGFTGNTAETPSVGEVFNQDTYVSRSGDVQVGKIIDQLKYENPEDVTAFTSGDTVSGELKTLLENQLGAGNVDAQMVAEASYEFLTTLEGQLQLYELVHATDSGQEVLQRMGYTSLESFMEADLHLDQVMELSKHMSTGELVGLNTFIQDMDAESIFGLSEVQEYSSPFEGVEGVILSDKGVIKSIDLKSAGITPDQISENIGKLGNSVEIVPSNSGPQISDRFRFVISEALGVTWDKVDFNVASPVMQEYFFQSDVGAEWVYDTVMENPDNQYLAVVRGYLQTFAESQGMTLEELGNEQNRDLIKSALAGPNQRQYGTRLTAILGGMSRSMGPQDALQIPHMKEEITRILTSQVK
jgi:hypothetical protein